MAVCLLSLTMGPWPLLLTRLTLLNSTTFGTYAACTFTAVLLEGRVKLLADDLLVVIFGCPIVETHTQLFKRLVRLVLLVWLILRSEYLGRRCKAFARFAMLRFRFIV